MKTPISTEKCSLLKERDAAQFRRMVRMDVESYNILLERIRPYITKETTNFGPPHSPELRFAVTVRYISTGTILQPLRLNDTLK